MVTSFQAEDVCNDNSALDPIEVQIWHYTMRPLQGCAERQACHSWDTRNRFESWRGVVRGTRLLLFDGVALTADLLRQLKSLRYVPSVWCQGLNRREKCGVRCPNEMRSSHHDAISNL
jgi:hypothetical protein